MAQTIFQRYEKKYLLDEAQYCAFLRVTKDEITADEYGKSTICNVYFDTPDSRLIRTSIEKPVYKEKLRLRSYGVPEMKSGVFLELKKKYKGIVYKRREVLSLWEAEQFLYDRQPLNQPTQISREIEWFLNYYPQLRPAMFLSYARRAFYGAADPLLRVTFDSQVLYRTEHLHLNSGVWGMPILETGEHLMELKFGGAMPLWLSHVLNELEIYPISFSKYGRCYLQTLDQTVKNGGEYSA